ncbi:acyl-CoA thioesterase [Oceanospirillum beijerinckii]|uniref:acyl-CoA thioesterase n=1 Tax=Oceanospirillum beijerinckii TaxID=64976 RepID=UPI0003FEB175|nr:thioesterase family protein [Oceanospirillum beijerinckii]
MARVRIEYPQEQTFFHHEMALRITDLNYGNHLAHDTLISLIHDARAQLFISHGHKEIDVDGNGTGVVVADLAISYRAEVFYPDTLTIEIAFDEMSRKGCDLVYRVTKASDGGLVAVAKTGIVFFDYNERKAAFVPEEFKQMIAEVQPVVQA